MLKRAFLFSLTAGAFDVDGGEVSKHDLTIAPRERPPTEPLEDRMTNDDRQSQCRDRAGRAWLLRLVPRAQGLPVRGKYDRRDAYEYSRGDRAFLETLTEEERAAARSKEILTTAVEVHA